MSFDGQKLFRLLPALYRLRDAQLAESENLLSPTESAQLQALQTTLSPLTPVQQQQLDQLTAKAARGPLQSLLALIGEQVAVIEEDLAQLYDDQFIETCARWVIPYIGDLIGYQAVNGIAPAVASPRAEVAHTISFRRRKGTVLVLEQLARDVTGWGAHAVEFFKLLADTQYMNHIRPHNYYAPDLRHWEPRAYMNTGFDATAHKVDVRRIAVERGRYNIQNIGIFLWSLNAYGLTMSPAVSAGDGACFRFNSLGRDMPLFNNPVSQGSDITAPAEPANVPNVLLRRVLCEDLQQTIQDDPAALNYDPGNSLALYIDGSLVGPSGIRVCDLSGDDGSWNNLPVAGSFYSAAIDPELGRIALPPPTVASPSTATSSSPQVQASFYYGFNGDLGGGEYPRAASFTASPTQAVIRVPGDYSTIQDALDALPGDGVVEITDSGRYSEPAGLAAVVKANGHIELRAGDGWRPTLVLGAELSVTGGTESLFDLNGLVITFAPNSPGVPLPKALVYAPDDGTNSLSQLGLTHCTLVPGWALTPRGDPQAAYSGQPTLIADTPGLEVVIKKSILGGLWVNGQATANLCDSIVDATEPSGVAYVARVDPTTNQPEAGGALTLEGCTVVGKVYASLLSLVSDSIFWARLPEPVQAGSPPSPSFWSAPLWASRKQQGCVRFSYLPAGSIIPRQFKCVEAGKGSPQPSFYSLRYGDPSYVKLLPSTDDAIRRGAHDGGEMGAFHLLLAPLRETDLRVRTLEYLPVGLEYGIFYET
jgi:hypothetical protein